MSASHSPTVRVTRLSPHVIQIAVPTPTLPPAFETNTYIIHCGSTALVVDAGSDDIEVLNALIQAIQAEGIQQVVGLLATHYHRDHTQGLPVLHHAFHAPVYVHPMDLESAIKEMKTGPAQVCPTPSQFQVGSIDVHLEHHPGHTHGHLHVLIPADGVILVGDHLAGDGSVWIGPPDGHMAPYYEALDAIADSGCQIAGPGHGTALPDAPAAARALKNRRLARETQMVDWLMDHTSTLDELVNHLYGGTVPPEAMWVAKKTVQAHLIHLIETHRVTRTFHESCQFVYHSS